jgi:hypothetical protein
MLQRAKVLTVIQTDDQIWLWYWPVADQVDLTQHTENEWSSHTRGDRTYDWPTTRKTRLTVDGRAEGVYAPDFASAMRYAAENWHDTPGPGTPADGLPEAPRGLPAG